MSGEVPVHESRQPVMRKHLAAMVCNIQRGLELSPIGLLGTGSYKEKNAPHIDDAKLVRAQPQKAQLPAPTLVEHACVT